MICTTGTKRKDRITMLLCCNMTGSVKRPLYVIGKSVNPRCFKSGKPPLEYDGNKTAWMTAELFTNWLKKWDTELAEAGTKILLILDNARVHPPTIELVNIELLFL